MENLQGRAVVQEDGRGLHIVIPTKKNWFAVVFLCAWLGGWFFGETMALGQLGKADTASGFVLFWLIGWTVGGAAALFAVLWQLAGRERIDVSAGVLTVGREILSVRISRQYDLANVKNWRLAALPAGSSAQQANAMTFTGRVAFDYGLKTRKFGIGLDDAEANYLVGVLSQRR
jgi:hypothetical protein